MKSCFQHVHRSPCLLLLWSTALALLWIVEPVKAQVANAPGANSNIAAGKAMLRVSCDAESLNSEVTINGVFSGDCPIDLAVSAGTIRLRVVKRVDANHERSFETEFRVVPDSIRRVDVILGGSKLNAEGLRQEAEASRLAELKRLEAERARLLAEESRLREEQETLARLEPEARAGNVAAMLELAQLIRAGRGASIPLAQADAWVSKATELNPLYVRVVSAPNYKKGHSRVDLAIDILLNAGNGWREVNAQTEAQVEALVAVDDFFQSTASGSVTFREKDNWGFGTYTCESAGRMTRISGTVANVGVTSTIPVEMTAALGGLLRLSVSRTPSIFPVKGGARAIYRLLGNPYPLEAGKVFGFDYLYFDEKNPSSQVRNQLVCRTGAVSGKETPLDCVAHQVSGGGHRLVIARHTLHSSGCYIPAESGVFVTSNWK